MKILLKSIIAILALAGSLTLLTPTGLAQTGADQAADMVRAATGGRVLSVSASNDPNSPGFAVKVLLPDGTVQIHWVNPQ